MLFLRAIVLSPPLNTESETEHITQKYIHWSLYKYNDCFRAQRCAQYTSMFNMNISTSQFISLEIRVDLLSVCVWECVLGFVGVKVLCAHSAI